MPDRHTEAAFESVIEVHLASSGGYTRGDRGAFDSNLCIDPQTFLLTLKAAADASGADQAVEIILRDVRDEESHNISEVVEVPE